jgi:hypothetical protein
VKEVTAGPLALDDTSCEAIEIAKALTMAAMTMSAKRM